MSAESFNLSESQWQTIEAFADAIIAPVGAGELHHLVPNGSHQDLEFVGTKPPSQIAGFRKNLLQSVRCQPEDKRRGFSILMSVLSTTGLSFPVTGTFKPVRDLTLGERWQVIKGLRESRIPQLRMVYRSLLDVVTFSYLFSDPRVVRTFGYVVPDPTIEIMKTHILYEPKFTEIPSRVGNGPSVIDADVVIIGSGASGGVAAHRLAKLGYNVVILEKARYLHPDEISINEHDKDTQVMENSGKITSSDGSINILAASTVGGGGAVNWSCSLDTPQAIREEWADAGVPFYVSTAYDDALDHVKEVMGVTLEYGPHSFTNQLILDGSKKLEYRAKACPQNTGRHQPNNRFHGYGYRFGEKGGIVNWLSGALDNGARIIDDAEVVRIVHSRGRASGVEVLVSGKPLVVNAKKVLVGGGSLQTPLLLQRSGFTNKHIGKGLKLHPVTVTYGDFAETVNKPDDTIMTAVCTQSDNLDGHNHGVKIEAISHTPHLLSKFLPWNNGDEYFRTLTRYKHLSALLILSRDKGDGRVWFDKSDPYRPRIDYATSDFDLKSLLKGCITGSNLLYIQGARRIILPLYTIPEFVSNKPTEQRRINDPDYQSWIKKVSTFTFQRYAVGLGSAHQMASVRMSNKGPKYAAVDEQGHLYEAENVHVIDTSVFPSASGVNPMISCMATAHILTGYVAEELAKTQRRARI